MSELLDTRETVEQEFRYAVYDTVMKAVDAGEKSYEDAMSDYFALTGIVRITKQRQPE